ncbi:MAG: hypothetical protein K6A90_04475 [Lachnospiraceae bacterium]|nr:hypothetical protein [Lachnospiraceae bacterium]
MPSTTADSFEKSYEKLSNAVDIDLAQGDNLASYMDKGDEDFFAGEKAEDGTTRAEIIRKVRENIIRRLKQENDDSLKTARGKRVEHINFSKKMAKSFASYSKDVNEYNAKDAAIQVIDQQIASETSSFKLMRLRNKRRHLESGYLGIGGRKALADSKTKKRAEIIKNAENWNKALDTYREQTFRKHYSTYDALALTWYEYTREYERQPAPALGAAPGPAAAAANPANPAALPAAANPAPAAVNPPNPPAAAAQDKREIDAGSEKNISEYVGIYDLTTLNSDTEAQFASYNEYTVPIKSRKDLSANSSNTEDATNHIKNHTRILMLGAADAQGVKERFKLDRTLHGQRSGKQFDPNSLDIPHAVPSPPPQYYDRMSAEEMNLEADEKDVYGHYLYSEKTAAIMEATVSKTDKRVHGFYINGQYVTDEDVAAGDRVSDKSDMKWRGRHSWDKQEKAEKLRAAIRKSHFFQHVNARTIQYYMSYGADSELTGSRQNEMAAYQSGNRRLTDANKDQYLKTMSSKGQGQALCQYVIDSSAAGPGQNSTFDCDTDPVIAYANNNHAYGLYQAALYLLSQEDPNLWKIARKIALICNETKTRTKYKVKNHFPETGNAMRMALLKEMAVTAPFSARMKADDLEGTFFDTTRREAYLEELNNRRGGFGLWLKKNLLNGNLRRKLSGAAGTLASGITDFQHAGALVDIENGREEDANNKDLTQAEKDARKEYWDKAEEDANAKYEGQEREVEMWDSYAQTVSAFSRLPSFISAGITLGVQFGTKDTAARDIFLDLNALTGVVANVLKLTEHAASAYRKMHMTQAEKDASLQDLDYTTAKDIVICIDSGLATLQCIASIISNHTTPGGVNGGVLEGENATLNKVMVYIHSAIDIFRRICAIINDSLTIHAARKRIARIDDANNELETALNAFKNPNLGTQTQREMGQAAEENAQAQYFMALTRMQSRKERSEAGFNIASNSLTLVKDIFNFLPDDPISLAIKGSLKIAPMIVDFVGWTVGKLKYDRQSFNENIASMLGDKEYAGTPYFDEVLKRETGIVNKEYLVDLARIFMSVDTHAMINNPNASSGEKELATTVVGTLYGNTRDANGASKYNVVQTIKLQDMLNYAGFDQASDWRAVLRNSIMK